MRSLPPESRKLPQERGATAQRIGSGRQFTLLPEIQESRARDFDFRQSAVRSACRALETLRVLNPGLPSPCLEQQLSEPEFSAGTRVAGGVQEPRTPGDV